MGFHLWRLANACTGLWRELFTRACFPVGAANRAIKQIAPHRTRIC
jgi:hypothetical protein